MANYLPELFPVNFYTIVSINTVAWLTIMSAPNDDGVIFALQLGFWLNKRRRMPKLAPVRNNSPTRFDGIRLHFYDGFVLNYAFGFVFIMQISID